MKNIVTFDDLLETYESREKYDSFFERVPKENILFYNNAILEWGKENGVIVASKERAYLSIIHFTFTCILPYSEDGIRIERYYNMPKNEQTKFTKTCDEILKRLSQTDYANITTEKLEMDWGDEDYFIIKNWGKYCDDEKYTNFIMRVDLEKEVPKISFDLLDINAEKRWGRTAEINEKFYKKIVDYNYDKWGKKTEKKVEKKNEPPKPDEKGPEKKYSYHIDKEFDEFVKKQISLPSGKRMTQRELAGYFEVTQNNLNKKIKKRGFKWPHQAIHKTKKK